MAVHDYTGLKGHVGHRLVCVAYGADSEAENVAVECETCHAVLFDFDREDANADEPND